MKIVQVVYSLSVGGAETMLKDIMGEQCKDNDITLIIVNDLVDETLLSSIDDRIKIIRLGRKEGSKNPWPIIRLNMLLYSLKPDIIHLQGDNLCKIVFLKRPYVTTIHNMGTLPGRSNKIYRHCAISKAVRDEWNESGFSTVLVENGINVASVRKRTSQINEPFIHFVQVSRLSISQKGQDLLIEAAERLIKDGITNFKVHLIGEGPDEVLLKNMVKERSVNDYFVFHGLKDRNWVYSHLADYNVFVQPSRYEGFGLTVAEACAAKIGVLVSDNEGPREILDNGKLGMTFENKSVDDLVEKMKRILTVGYDTTLIEKAYQRVADLYDVKLTAQKYLDVYNKVISETKRK